MLKRALRSVEISTRRITRERAPATNHIQMGDGLRTRKTIISNFSNQFQLPALGNNYNCSTTWLGTESTKNGDLVDNSKSGVNNSQYHSQDNSEFMPRGPKCAEPGTKPNKYHLPKFERSASDYRETTQGSTTRQDRHDDSQYLHGKESLKNIIAKTVSSGKIFEKERFHRSMVTSMTTDKFQVEIVKPNPRLYHTKLR